MSARSSAGGPPWRDDYWRAPGRPAVRDDSIGVFEVGPDGELVGRGFVTGLPASMVGLVAT